MFSRILIKFLAKHVACRSPEQQFFPKTLCFSTSAADKPMDFLKYNTEECEKIINTINNSSLEELLRYKISKMRGIKLLTWKNKNGPLQRVEDLLDIGGISVTALQKFCNSLLAGDPKEVENTKAATRRKISNILTPVMSSTQRDAIRSCVSVRIGVSSVSWSRLELPGSPQSVNQPCVLTDWQHHDLIENKLHLAELVQRCIYYDCLIPDADCYILENPKIAQVSNNTNVDLQNINIQKAQITAMIGFALAARRRLCSIGEEQSALEEKAEENDEQLQFGLETIHSESQPDKANNEHKEPLPNVFYMRRLLSARLFNLLVGNEHVSTEQTVLELMRTHYNAPWSDLNAPATPEHLNVPSKPESSSDEVHTSVRGNVQFSSEFRFMFSRAERYQREFLGQALLMNLTFLRLVLLRDAESLAKITKHQRLGDLEIKK